MTARTNDLGQPIGAALPDWQAVAPPARTEMIGRFCRLEPIDGDRHARDLADAFSRDKEGRIWTYLPYGPLDSEAAVKGWIAEVCLGEDPLFFAIVDSVSGQAQGVASYLRIQAEVGVIEVGHINFSPLLQQRAAATEAMYLMMRRVFDELGYRRYEWKCDSLNAGSCRAATRLGFGYDGLFRQATIYKGRNRDTAWYSILDSDWPALRRAFEGWLAPGNFDGEGRQKAALGSFIAKEKGTYVK